MQLINSQYKVKGQLKEDLRGSTLVTEDIFSGVPKHLKIIEGTESTRDFITYMKKNYAEYRNIIHPNISQFHFFNKIISIDNKPISSTKYYISSQAVSGESLSTFAGKATLEEKITVFYQLISAVKFLHTRGFLLCNVNYGELFVERWNEPRLVITSLPFLEHCHKSERYEKENIKLISPESFQFGNFTRLSDIYLIGELGFYLFFSNYKNSSIFTEDYAEFTRHIENMGLSGLNDLEVSIFEILGKCVSRKIMERYHSVEEIHHGLNKALREDRKICDRDCVQRLPENMTKQVGREPLIGSVINQAYECLLSGNNRSVALIKGSRGTGKSALLKTLLFRFSQEGFNISSEDASLSRGEEFYTIKAIIRNLRKYSSTKVLDKYNDAIAEVLAETNEKRKNHRENSRTDENINKISQYILEVSELVPLVVCIDNIETIDEKSLTILYHILNAGSGRVFLVLSEGTYLSNKKKGIEDFLTSLEDRKISIEYPIGDLNGEETGEFVRLLLSMDRVPQELAAAVFLVTNGNPAGIYELIHKLVTEEKIVVNEVGEWDIHQVNLNDLKYSAEEGNNLGAKVKRLVGTEKAIIEILSVLNIPGTLPMLVKMTDLTREEIVSNLRKLEGKGFLFQRSDDSGATFHFTNNAFKTRLYESLSDRKKRLLHRLVIDSLADSVALDEHTIEEEIIHQKISIGKEADVIKYLVELGEQAEAAYNATGAVKYYTKALHILERAKDSAVEITLSLRLGKIYEGLSEFEHSIDMYRMAQSLAVGAKDKKARILSELGLVDMYINMGLKSQARVCVVNAKNLLRGETRMTEEALRTLLFTVDVLINYKKFQYVEKALDHILGIKELDQYGDLKGKALILKAKLRIDQGSLGVPVESLLMPGIELLEKAGDWKNLIKALNIMGIYYDNAGKDNEAIESYEQGLYIGEKTNRLEYHLRLYNNIAEIHRKEDRNREAIALYMKAINMKGSEYYALVVGINYYNLALTYTEMEYIKESIQYKEVYEKFLETGQGMEYLEEFHLVHLSQFYFQVGDFQKTVEYAKKAEALCEKWGIAADLEANMYRILGEANLYHERNYAREMELLQNALERKNYKIFRLICVRLAIMSIHEGKIAKGLEMYSLGMQYQNEIDTERINFYYSLVESYFYKGIERLNFLMNLSDRADRMDGYDLRRLLYRSLGEAYCDTGDLRKGIYYFAFALNYLRKGLSHIPEEHKKTYLESHHRYFVKESIITYGKKLYEENQMDEFLLLQLLENQHFVPEAPENYFDFETLRKICITDEYEEYYREERIVSPLENLTNRIISGLVGSPERNLDHYIEVITKVCHGSSGFLLDYHGDDQSSVIASYGTYTKKEYHRAIAENVMNTGEVFYIKDIYDYNGDEMKALFGENISSIVCIPVLEENKDGSEGVFDKRKKNTGKSAILGLLFIESESVINNLTLNSIEMIKVTRKLCHLLMDNIFLHEMVSVDRLTQLYTRKHFEAALAIEIEKIARVESEFSIIMCDIDKFKGVNDSFGHQMGDEILRKVSALIMGSVRKEDICARYGGEEIVILLPGANSVIAMGISEKIRMKVEGAKLLGNQRSLTVSIGVASCPEHSTWANDLIEKADQALYFAKEAGRNRCVLFSQTLNKEPKRIDKLAGIVTGELVNDQRSVETILEIVQLSRRPELSEREKHFQFLGRVIETAEADFGGILRLNPENEVIDRLFRRKLTDHEIDEIYYNREILDRCLNNQRGEYLIDWGNYPGMDKHSGMPDWQSAIVAFIKNNKEEKLLLYLSVSLRNKEFTSDVYNFVKTLCDMISVV